jgi:hypothetical protein
MKEENLNKIFADYQKKFFEQLTAYLKEPEDLETYPQNLYNIQNKNIDQTIQTNTLSHPYEGYNYGYMTETEIAKRYNVPKKTVDFEREIGYGPVITHKKNYQCSLKVEDYTWVEYTDSIDQHTLDLVILFKIRTGSTRSYVAVPINYKNSECMLTYTIEKEMHARALKDIQKFNDVNRLRDER